MLVDMLQHGCEDVVDLLVGIDLRDDCDAPEINRVNSPPEEQSCARASGKT